MTGCCVFSCQCSGYSIWIVIIIIVPLSILLLTTFLTCFIAGIRYLAKRLEACMCMLSGKC